MGRFRLTIAAESRTTQGKHEVHDQSLAPAAIRCAAGGCSVRPVAWRSCAPGTKEKVCSVAGPKGLYQREPAHQRAHFHYEWVRCGGIHQVRRKEGRSSERWRRKSRGDSRRKEGPG